MQSYIVKPSNLSGECSIPTSKSQSIRAILFASMATGTSVIKNALQSPDIIAMIAACKQLGAQITEHNNELIIEGISGNLRTPDDVIDAGNSGQVLRFIACLAGLQENYMVITGDASIRHNRPVGPLIDALPKLGVSCVSLRGDGRAPLILKGPYTDNSTKLDGADSQPVSGLIMAAALRDAKTIINVENPGETPWIDLTLSWLQKFNIAYIKQDYSYYEIIGRKNIAAFNYQVPGDLSSLSFPLAAALITQAEITIHNVDMKEPQGDKAIVEILQQMGANISLDATNKTLHVAKTTALNGITVDINHCIDCIAILATIACYAHGETKITGAAIAREKESDRITAICSELKKMGANITELPDGMVIKQSNLHGATVDSHHDHRIAMSLAVAGLIATGETTITNTKCVSKSFPDFCTTMQKLGANIALLDE
jgi:3-phosphoshikimate 1-carboxyvinyltransferase